MGTYTMVLDGRQAKRKMAELDEKMSSAWAKKTFEIAEETRMRARILVPQDTKKTKDAILSVVKVRDKNFGEVRVGFERNPHPEKTWGGGQFNLPAWMTYSRAAVDGWSAYGHGHTVFFKSGNPRFLLIAAGEARTKYGKEIKAMTGAIIKG